MIHLKIECEFKQIGFGAIVEIEVEIAGIVLCQ